MLEMLFKMIILLFLIILSVEDIVKKEIHTLPIVVLGIVAAISGRHIDGLIVDGILLLAKRIFKDSLGMGDCLLIGALSFETGALGMLYMLGFTFFLSSMAGIVLLMAGRGKHYKMSFVPYIFFGYVVWWCYV